MKITKKQAGRFLLAYQKLLPPRKMKGKDGVLQYIHDAGCIQFDPLNMVGINPHLVLQSRIYDYRKEYLQELLYSDRKLLDGWDKNMSIYPAEDWPFFKRYRDEAYKKHGGKSSSIAGILPEIRETIAREGPLSSIDLKFDDLVDWPWAPTRASRAALESMYFWGELIIHHKEGTRKVYDFTDKYLPREILSLPDPNRTMKRYYEWQVKRRIGSVGMLWDRPGDAWLGIRWMKSGERSEAFKSLLRRGEIIALEVEDVKHPIYILKEDEPLLDDVLRWTDIQKEAAFIAPLDNLLWDRKLIEEIFDFKYTWEVYKPVSERKYGYYVLPVIYGDAFAARFEPRYSKKTGKLEILNWWWEKKTVVSKDMRDALQECLEQFLGYLGASGVEADDTRAQDLTWINNILYTHIPKNDL
jgi:uncharacterized protein YcaQ